jgi:putative N6-adenine-specific DNA methylase
VNSSNDFEIFLVASPGFEKTLCDEARKLDFNAPTQVPGGVTLRGGWRDVWRANLELRGASRVLARIGEMRVMHLAQLDKRARKFPWADFLLPDVPIRVEATCKGSRIYHGGAAAQRIATAIHEELGAPITADAELCIKVRIDDDLCTISIDTSGESLHKRGHKEAIGKAPMRETLASLFLRECGFDGAEPVVDPMCGSGTFVIEAAEMAAGLKPGRSRSFAFEKLATFDSPTWKRLHDKGLHRTPHHRFYGRDRDAGAIKMSLANAERANVTAFTDFRQQPISILKPPEGMPGLVIINPPYGTRIKDKKPLYDLYSALGQVLAKHFTGWRVGVITTEAGLAKATALPLLPKTLPVLHGGLRVHLFQTARLG